MTIGPFVCGSTPLDPAVITILDADGEPRNLTNYTPHGTLWTPDGAGIDLSTAILDAAEGTVQCDWPVPSAFDLAGTHKLQVELTSVNPDVLEITSTVDVTVVAAQPPPQPVVATDAVFLWTNVAVSADDSLHAQFDIGTFIGVDIDARWDELSERSRYWTGVAIAHQAAWMANGGPSQVPNATSVRTGDASVTYASTSTEASLIAPMARVALGRITARTMYASPFLGDPDRTPMRPMWVSV